MIRSLEGWNGIVDIPKQLTPPPFFIKTSTGDQKPNQQTLFFDMDSLGTPIEIFRNARGSGRDWYTKQRLFGSQTKMQFGWNHSCQICQPMSEGLGAGDGLEHWLDLAG